jgi:hypothetical protein
VNRIAVVILCVVLCLAGTNVLTTSANLLSTSAKTALCLCLQQEYLLRDTYQEIFAKYPTLTTFRTVATDESRLVTALLRVFTEYRVDVPTDARAHDARALANMATTVSLAYSTAITLEQSTSTLMAQLLQTTRSTDVTSVEALIRTTSVGLHTAAFVAEQTTAASPTPLPRPFPAPVTMSTVTVPASIDKTGMTDTSTALTNFICGVPDGSLISFPPSAVYRIDRAVFLKGRHNLILEGNGCTLKYTSVTGTSQSYSLWYDEGAGSDIWIRNFVLIGSSTNPGVYTPGTSPTGGEHQHGVVAASSRFEVSGCTVSAVWGDGFYVTNNSSDVWIHDNHVISAGRNGLTVISAKNLLAEHNSFDRAGYHTVDIEPNHAFEACVNIVLRMNTAGTYGKYFFNAVNIPGAIIDEIVVDGNTVTGGSVSAYIDSVGAVRMTRITFANNAGKAAASGPLLFFKHLDELTVAGNTQLLSSGFLIRIIDCTGVVAS